MSNLPKCFYVRINQNYKPENPYDWYGLYVGEVFLVMNDETDPDAYIVVSGVSRIQKSDCTVVNVESWLSEE
jgi:hypothetical protein